MPKQHSHWEDGRSACPYGPDCDAPDPHFPVATSDVPSADA